MSESDPVKEKDNRPFFKALVYEQDGDLNLTWFFVLIMGLVGSIGFFTTVVICRDSSVLEKIAAWSFLAGAFASVLIAAIPISKAKILAKATLPGELAKSVASVAQNVEQSTDVQEIYNKTQTKSDEIG